MKTTITKVQFFDARGNVVCEAINEVAQKCYDMTRERQPITARNVYGYTMFTSIDRTYRFVGEIEITPGDEGATVYDWSTERPTYVGVIVNQKLVRAGG